MLKLLKKIDEECEKYVEIFVLWLTIVILRIPNFFEPYWYGDEAIYLTLGIGLRKGLRLYTDIIDHKTPLIYYLAMVPNQFYFRLLNLGWMLATSALFFLVAKSLFKKTKLAFASSFVFVLLTTLPWLEGHIPNGELFVLGFVMAGLWLLTKTHLWQNFLAGRARKALIMAPKETLFLLGSGILFGLGVLTKVPALLDFGTALLICWFALVTAWTTKTIRQAERWQVLWQFLVKFAWLFLGLLIPIALSIVYFISRGSGQDYLNFGLLYNFRYAGSWQLNLTNPLLEFLFTLPGKLITMAGIIVTLSFWKKFTPRFQLLGGWLALALFATLLSNRNYPHYFIQLVPPAALLLVELWQASRKRMQKTMLAMTLGLLALPLTAGLILGVRPFSTGEYYGKFIKLITGRMTMEQYDQSFNPFVKDNYAAAEAIRGLNGDRIFIWGTNPMLYALTQTTPTSRFTVSFHIKDFDDYQLTLKQIKQAQPKLIIVMKDETQEFPGLQPLLDSRYYPNTQYESMTLWLLQERL